MAKRKSNKKKSHNNTDKTVKNINTQKDKTQDKDNLTNESKDSGSLTEEDKKANGDISDDNMMGENISKDNEINENIPKDNDNQEDEEEITAVKIPTSDDVIDLLLSDKNRVMAIAGAFILFFGSFLSFWGLAGSDIGRVSEGSLLTGYLLGGVFGKLCVMSGVVAAVCLCISKLPVVYAKNCAIVSLSSYTAQVFLIAVLGSNKIGSGIPYPGIGAFVSLAGIILMMIYIKKIN